MKTKPCHYKLECFKMDTCTFAHFKNEYKVPRCSYDRFCKNKYCTLYHSHLGTEEQYMNYMKIHFDFNSKEEWISYMTYKRRKEVEKRYYEVMNNKKLLSEYLWKTRPCIHGIKCVNIEKCCGAHFKDEHRIPICLNMEFCQNTNCNFYHPHKETKDKYLIRMNIDFKYESLQDMFKQLKDHNEKTKMKNLLPLYEPYIGIKDIKNNIKDIKNKFTMFCKNMSSDKKCPYPDCAFAHSINQLVINNCDYYNDTNKKTKIAEEILKIKIEPFMFKDESENNEYLFMLKQHQDFILELKKEEDENRDFIIQINKEEDEKEKDEDFYYDQENIIVIIEKPSDEELVIYMNEIIKNV